MSNIRKGCMFIAGGVPDRRRIGNDNVIWGYRNTVLVLRRTIGKRAMGEGGLKMGRLALSKGLARMGIYCHVQRAVIPSKGSFFFS